MWICSCLSFFNHIHDLSLLRLKLLNRLSNWLVKLCLLFCFLNGLAKSLIRVFILLQRVSLHVDLTWSEHRCGSQWLLLWGRRFLSDCRKRILLLLFYILEKLFFFNNEFLKLWSRFLNLKVLKICLRFLKSFDRWVLASFTRKILLTCRIISKGIDDVVSCFEWCITINS